MKISTTKLFILGLSVSATLPVFAHSTLTAAQPSKDAQLAVATMNKMQLALQGCSSYTTLKSLLKKTDENCNYRYAQALQGLHRFSCDVDTCIKQANLAETQKQQLVRLAEAVTKLAGHDLQAVAVQYQAAKKDVPQNVAHVQQQQMVQDRAQQHAKFAQLHAFMAAHKAVKVAAKPFIDGLALANKGVVKRTIKLGKAKLDDFFDAPLSNESGQVYDQAPGILSNEQERVYAQNLLHDVAGIGKEFAAALKSNSQ